jgi:glycosyltransferase involved in cell wall biosynthesis
MLAGSRFAASCPASGGARFMTAFGDEGPRISCLMVTADRRNLAERSVDCFLSQHYPNRELVVVDDGAEDYTPILAAIPPERLIHHRLVKDPARTLGELRNLSLDLARGDLLAQWDDDDWFDPERLTRQYAALGGKAACWTHATLVHLDDPQWLERPYIGHIQGGAPSTILHVRDDAIRYPSERKGEDSTYRDDWGRRGAVTMGTEWSALLIRCFHGSNTWERDHFTRRVALRPIDIVEWNVRKLLGATEGYSQFRLTPRQRASFDAFYAQSRALGIF